MSRLQPFPAEPLPGLPVPRRGKVRDVFAAGRDQMVIVATDRISAFDVVLEPGIPGKGIILNQVSNFWFNRLVDLAPNHLLATEPADFPPPFTGRSELAGRSVLVRRLDMLPVECVVRGYIVGSGWKEYQDRGSVCGLPLPVGLRLADRLPEPLFTPSTKADVGHDENISFEQVVELIGSARAEQIRELSLALYRQAAAYAEERGIIIADTKLEFGLDDEERLVLADEVFTPDSSRFWPVAEYRPGSNPPSFDKQFVRDWLETSGWDKNPPAPSLPTDVQLGTLERYREAYRRITGRDVL